MALPWVSRNAGEEIRAMSRGPASYFTDSHKTAIHCGDRVGNRSYKQLYNIISYNLKTFIQGEKKASKSIIGHKKSIGKVKCSSC